MVKKYELLANDTIQYKGRILHRIKALISFGNIKAGDLGGWIEKEDNLSQHGNAWVSGNADIFGNARIFGDACVFGNAWVFGNARISEDAIIASNHDFITIGPIGSRDDYITFFKTNINEIYVNVGCFSNTIDEFRKAVKETHGDNEHGIEYNILADVAEKHLKI